MDFTAELQNPSVPPATVPVHKATGGHVFAPQPARDRAGDLRGSHQVGICPTCGKAIGQEFGRPAGMVKRGKAERQTLKRKCMMSPSWTT